MATSPIDMNAMAQSIYDTVMSLQQTAAEMVGLDTLWCRALPYENSEDVIVQEYTLSNVDCPKPIKVISDKTDYQAGTFTFGALGIDFDTDLSISINIPDWEALYGKGTMPQKGDIVIIKLINRAYEVSSSSVVYTLTAMPTSYKCVLRKYQRTASRRETEDFRVSIDELTTSQETLFGDAISKEVADAVVETETSYNQTTYVDPMKDFDMDSVIMERVEGYKNQIITDAYYDFKNATKNVKYSIDAVYDKNDEESNHWIFSAWFRIPEIEEAEEGIIKFQEIYSKEKNYWYFEISQSAIQLHAGDNVTLLRGTMLSVSATIDTRECETGLVVKVPASEVMKLNKKLTNWWASGVWKVVKQTTVDIFSGFNGDDNIYNISVRGDKVTVRLTEHIQEFPIAKEMNLNNWHYMMFELSPSNMHMILLEEAKNEKTNKYKQVKNIDSTYNVNIDNFTIDNFSIQAKQTTLNIANIRLYENKYSIEDKYKIDMYSPVTKNASKLILVDGPRPGNEMRFFSPVR